MLWLHVEMWWLKKILQTDWEVHIIYDLIGAHICEGEFITSYGMGTKSTNTTYTSVSIA